MLWVMYYVLLESYVLLYPDDRELIHVPGVENQPLNFVSANKN